MKPLLILILLYGNTCFAHDLSYLSGSWVRYSNGEMAELLQSHVSNNGKHLITKIQYYQDGQPVRYGSALTAVTGDVVKSSMYFSDDSSIQMKSIEATSNGITYFANLEQSSGEQKEFYTAFKLEGDVLIQTVWFDREQLIPSRVGRFLKLNKDLSE